MSYDCINTMNTSSSPKLSWGQWIKAGEAIVKADITQLMVMLMVWQQRSVECRCLREMSDRTLFDIGITRARIDQEAAKPFWRP